MKVSPVRNQLGRGRVVYISGVKPSVDKPPAVRMLSEYWKLPENWNELVEAVNEAAAGRLSTEVNAPLDVVVEVTAQKEAGKLLVRLLDYDVARTPGAIDYLLTRPEVDPQRIGSAGQSGRGTFTLFISALDERVKCAVVVEGGTTSEWPIVVRPETRVAIGDTEQNLFPAAAVHGVDRPDSHIAIAPRPLLVLAEKYSAEFNDATQRIRTRYQQLA